VCAGREFVTFDVALKKGSDTLSHPMSGRLSLPRWTSHPAFGVFGFVFLMRDLVFTALGLGALVAGGLANQATLSVVAVSLGGLALAGVVASSVTGQRREVPAVVPSGHNALPESPPVEVTVRDPLADQMSSGRQLQAEIREAQEQGVWDDDGWAYRKRVEAWTERTARVLEARGRDDLARALLEVEVPPRPPFEALLNGQSPAYARLIGLLDGRIELLEDSQG
jgi:hypothetical protein